jgi:hypothetical protein
LAGGEAGGEAGERLSVLDEPTESKSVFILVMQTNDNSTATFNLCCFIDAAALYGAGVLNLE